MCLGGKSSAPKQQAPPAPNPPTTFDYQAGGRDVTADQRRANMAVNQANSATVLSQTTGQPFGADLGGMAKSA